MLRALAVLLLCLPTAAFADTQAPATPRPHTAGPTVRSFIPPLRMPRLGFARGLRVYLPPDYAGSAKRYPVIYMFDGQNLFDDATSYVGEWGVDEAMDAIAREDGFGAIVVGIDHGDELRINELIPYFNVRFLPNAGGAFIEDVVTVIKPFVDANYRTLPDRDNTAIIGSSLGGLSADYSIHRYPLVFGKAGVFSPSYWVSDTPFANARRTPLPAGARVYLYIGGREGEESVPLVEKMAQVLQAQPGGADTVTMHVVAEAEHNETAWRVEFPRAVRWLFRLPPAVAGQ
ncbi:alpha/beta hydrolase [Lysobacter solisilvae (ex Woo and Kim 2020)]|uniref:Alpha/beta hydrolase n=1 Tax=Agrilutibacter terrestris TaxID=2865112 RepID=A0A7H0FWY6_9GAMM|nr:alpha/beta hydrolase-fold protein [Lysobacter terrestris]QNP40552.1 alpha/beta hydrolase [Lysobacter terrestris]